MAKMAENADHWVQSQLLNPDGSRNDSGCRDLTRLSIATLHAQSSWDGAKPLAWLRMVSAFSLLRLGTMACMGELRHWKARGPSGDPMTPMTPSDMGGSRSSVHAKTAKCDLEETVDRLRTMRVDFHQHGWSGSFGGSNWGDCADACFRLGVALADFFRLPHKDNWSEVASAMNEVVHVTHNNAELLTKFAANKAWDNAHDAPQMAFSLPRTMDAMLAARNLTVSESRKTLVPPAMTGIELAHSARFSSDEARKAHQRTDGHLGESTVQSGSDSDVTGANDYEPDEQPTTLFSSSSPDSPLWVNDNAPGSNYEQFEDETADCQAKPKEIKGDTVIHIQAKTKHLPDGYVGNRDYGACWDVRVEDHHKLLAILASEENVESLASDSVVYTPTMVVTFGTDGLPTNVAIGYTDAEGEPTSDSFDVTKTGWA
jgi:hypothetical protein